MRYLRSSAEALGKIGPETREAAPALTGLLKDGDKHTRAIAGYAPGRIGPEAKAAAPAPIELLKDEDTHVRSRAACGLSGIGPGAGFDSNV